jgi:ATPases involved in chromosome partitioning
MFGLFGKKIDTARSEALRNALGSLVDPHARETLADAHFIERAEVAGDVAHIDVVLDYPAAGYEAELTEQLERIALQIEGIKSAKTTIAFVSPIGSSQNGKPLPGVRNIIAVASGKGGVGKSTTSVNLALALAAEGATVGLLDADIYGPSQPLMLGSKETPIVDEQRAMQPVMAHGLQTMSIGYLIDDAQAMVWRGPMVTSALMQLLNDTRWHDLDYLIVDMPPGTGDIQLTLAQKVPVAGSVIVTTPQTLPCWMPARPSACSRRSMCRCSVSSRICRCISARTAAISSLFSVRAAAKNWQRRTMWICWGNCRWI